MSHSPTDGNSTRGASGELPLTTLLETYQRCLPTTSVELFSTLTDTLADHCRAERWSMAWEVSASLRTLRRSIGIDPDSIPRLALLHAWCGIEAGEFDAALRCLNSMPSPPDRDMALSHGVAYRRAGSPERALTVFLDALRLAPDDAELQREVVVTSLEIPREVAAALEWSRLRSPLLTEPQNVGLWVWYALHADDSGDVSNALGTLEHSWFELEPDLLSKLLTAILERGYDRCFQRVVKAMLASDRGGLLGVLQDAGRQALLRSDVPLAIACFERALASKAHDARLLAEAAACFSWSIEPRVAARGRALANQVLDLDPPPSGPTVEVEWLYAFGLASTVLGRWREVEGLRKALAQQADLPAFGDLLPPDASGSRRLAAATVRPPTQRA